MSTDTVIVCCKLPNGLHLDLEYKNGTKVRHTVVGANASRIVGGYGMTPNVPAEFMTEWMRKNAKHPSVANGDIFVQGDVASAIALAKEQREIITGFEAIDPVKEHMLDNENEEVDKKALRAFQMKQAENPVRSRQVIE